MKDEKIGKMLKVAMLGHKCNSSREGGIEVVVEELSTRRVGHKVTCYNRRGHHVSGSEFDGDKLTECKGIRLKNVFTINRKSLAAMSSSHFSHDSALLVLYKAPKSAMMTDISNVNLLS